MPKTTQPSRVVITTDAMLGRISRNMIRSGRSPVTTAAATKSLPRIDLACARSTRAEPAQPVITRTRTTVEVPGGRNAARMTSSGRPGSSRKTFVNRVSASSTSRPKYADARPTRMAMPVAASPTVNPTNIEERAPHRVSARTSCPFVVVPSQCAPEGAWLPVELIRDGSPGARTGASSASSAKTASRHRPDSAFLLPRSWRASPRRRPGPCAVGAAGGVAAGVLPAMSTAVMSRRLPSADAHARVEADVDDVDQEVRQEHGCRDGEEDALHQRVVETLHGCQQLEADAWVGKHDLGEQSAADDEAEAHAEVGDGGEQCVAGGVAEHDPRGAQPLRLRHGDVVLGCRGDHGVAHAEHPAADGDGHDGEGREHEVGAGVRQELG